MVSRGRPTTTFQLIDPAREHHDRLDVSRELLDGLAFPAAILDLNGLVLTANHALSERLQVANEQIVGQPLLLWIRRVRDAGAFGRAFIDLRQRTQGHSFSLELTLTPKRADPFICQVRANKLSAGNVLVTCRASLSTEFEQVPERSMGQAISRCLEALDHGMVLLDSSGQIVHANPAARQLLASPLIGRSLLEFADPASMSRLSEALDLAAAGSWYGEVDLATPAGDRVPVELSLAAGRGSAQSTVALLRDLSARRNREFEQRLTALIDRRLVSSVLPHESVPAACTALMDAFECERASVVTKVGGKWERWRVDADHSVYIEELEGAPPDSWASAPVVDPCPGDDPTHTQIFGVTPRDASTCAVRVLLAAPSGIVGYLLLLRPSELTREERALLSQLASQLGLGLANGLLVVETEALASYQAMLLDQTTVMLNSLDADGRIVRWNRASEQLLGISEDQAHGKRFGIDIAQADPNHWRELWHELLERGAIARELVVSDGNGSPVPLHVEARVLRDADSVRGAVLVGLDLRHRRALEDQVLKSQKLAAVGLLAAGIAHEINNPLTGVVGYSKLLLEKQLEPRVREMVEKIAVSGERCRKIVEGVLLFSRQKDGLRRRFDLAQLIDRVVAIGEYQWRMHNVTVLRQLDPGPSEIVADADQIEQVLLNLCSNAVDAMTRGGTLQIALTRHDAQTLRLSVTDDGHGIPDEVKARIFDPFFSTKEIGKGTGLGLAISYGIIKDHGGDILVDSRPQRGTTFTVLLPMSPENPVYHQPSQQPSSSSKQSHEPTRHE